MEVLLREAGYSLTFFSGLWEARLKGATVMFVHVNLQSWTVEDLKVAVWASQGIPPDQQQLIYEGKQLEGGRTLARYGITHGAAVIMMLRLRGC